MRQSALSLVVILCLAVGMAYAGPAPLVQDADASSLAKRQFACPATCAICGSNCMGLVGYSCCANGRVNPANLGACGPDFPTCCVSGCCPAGSRCSGLVSNYQCVADLDATGACPAGFSDACAQPENGPCCMNNKPLIKTDTCTFGSEYPPCPVSTPLRVVAPGLYETWNGTRCAGCGPGGNWFSSLSSECRPPNVSSATWQPNLSTGSAWWNPSTAATQSWATPPASSVSPYPSGSPLPSGTMYPWSSAYSSGSASWPTSTPFSPIASQSTSLGSPIPFYDVAEVKPGPSTAAIAGGVACGLAAVGAVAFGLTYASRRRRYLAMTSHKGSGPRGQSPTVRAWGGPQMTADEEGPASPPASTWTAAGSSATLTTRV